MHRAKKLEKSHDPLALVVHTSSSSRTTSPYYVTYPASVVDYDDDYQGDEIKNTSEDPLTCAMILLARTTANVQCYSCSEKGHYARNCPKLRVRGSNYFMGIEEFSVDICLMARIQPTNFDSDAGPSYDSAYLSEIQTPSTSYVNPLFAKDKQEQKYPKQPKVINNTIGNDQINSNIIFDEPNEDVNSGSIKYDNNVQESYELEQLARNAFNEAKKQQIISKKVQQQNTVLIKQLESYKEKLAVVELKGQTVELQKTQTILKRKMSKNEDKYHDTVLDLEARAKKNEDVVLKIGLSAASSVRRPLNTDSSLKNSVLSNTKKSSKKVDVSVSTNKKTYVASKNVVLNKKIVTDVDVQNALKVKDVLCVSCAKNMLIPSHDKCLANYKLNVHSKVRRALFTTPRTTKFTFEDITRVVSKTRFSVKTTQSESLDTTFVVSRSKIAVVTPLHARNKVVQIVLWIVDSGCSKHITGDRSLLKNFVEKFMGIVRFGNDHFASITGYDDYVQGNITFCHVYYVEGLGHNLFSVGQSCDGARESNLHNISILDIAASSPVCIFAKATSTKSWLWHRRLSHLNFGTINDLTKHDLVDGLPKFKYKLLYMDLCGPMRVASINGKKYILVIVDDYSQFTWVYFLHTKSETPEIIKTFIARVQLNYNAKIHKIQTDNDTEFKNTTLKAHYERYNKTPYELLHGRKPNVEYFHVFGSLCYPTNYRGDIGKMKPKANIGIFIGYSETSRGPMYKEYFEKTSSNMTINFAEQQVHNHEDSPLTYSIIVEEHEAPPIVTTSEEQNSPISLNEADEFNQEDSADFDGNTVFVPYDAPNFEQANSSTTTLDPSNMHEFHQVQPSTHIWIKAHPLEQVIGDPSKPMMTQNRLQTESELCMYALTVSTLEPNNIKEAMLYHSWIESMQDELHQLERLDV
ncbi:retrovirus-related pol polyprotein from transposon TNT 1-94 [Tanacetum coccineum]